MADPEQLTLPIQVRKAQTVEWINVDLEEQRRFLGFLGNKTVSRVLWTTGKYGMDDLSRTVIKTDVIDKVEDPNLRYALRFEAAAKSMGWIQDSPGSSHGHFVTVDATDEGLKGRFVGAIYTGVAIQGSDTFLDDLRSFDPSADENH